MTTTWGASSQNPPPSCCYPSLCLHVAIDSWQFLQGGVGAVLADKPQPAHLLPRCSSAKQDSRCHRRSLGGEGCHVDRTTAAASVPLTVILGKDGECPNLPETNGKCRNRQRIEALREETAPCECFTGFHPHRDQEVAVMWRLGQRGRTRMDWEVLCPDINYRME